ncbi:hypothetical protein AMATHDRAFT_51570 [Amanita thiersii Skay4041]|uniref:Uncharacterized protein n=1 Tax=Amanita thiersii Skay4041 TaxID=703135 RepID=A0A2A9ND09_9AGAR|nr:hypothetical protein AMATHDRAFT_51570 [Amanita thiersii Skay4041]
MSASFITFTPAAVAGQQRKSGGFVRPKAILDLQASKECAIPEDQIDGFDFYSDMRTPPLMWDSDSDSQGTPSHLKSVFEDWDDPVPSSTVIVTEDNDGVQTVNISAASSFYRAPERRPFDYAPFSDSSFPHTFRAYPEGSVPEEDRFSAQDGSEVLSKEKLPLSQINTFIFDVESEMLSSDNWLPLKSPDSVQSAIEVGSKHILDVPASLTYEDIDR